MDDTQEAKKDIGPLLAGLNAAQQSAVDALVSGSDIELRRLGALLRALEDLALLNEYRRVRAMGDSHWRAVTMGARKLGVSAMAARNRLRSMGFGSPRHTAAQ